MPIINLAFKSSPILKIAIADTKVGNNYYQLVKDNYIQSPPIFRDRKKYTLEYMITLAHQAKQVLGWDWVKDSYDTSTAILLHKNLEEALANGFESVPAEHDHLFHELHYCLHVVSDNLTPTRKGWLQVEWYNSQGFDLDNTFTFSHVMGFGDVKLQNPYVGHPPQTIFEENDNINIPQTCKFHDFVRPGINIAIQQFPTVDKPAVVEYFKQYSPEFVNQHGVDKIMHYTGYPVIGQVINLDDLEIVVGSDRLEFDYMEFSNE